MKRLLLTVFAVFALSSCAKNEEIPANDELKEITFTSIVNPLTKADGEPVAMNTSVKFKLFAYHLPIGKSWTDNENEATLYVEDAMFGYIDGQWKCVDHPCYWPKSGSLKFYAWTDMTDMSNEDEVAAFSSKITCTNEANKRGIQIEKFSIIEYPNKELYVATPCISGTSQIPQLNFRSVLTKVSFSVTVPESNPAGSIIKLKSISFDGVHVESNYNQSTYERSYEFWDTTFSLGDIPVFTDTEGLILSGTTNVEPKQGDYYLIIPTHLVSPLSPSINLKYSITTGNETINKEKSKLLWYMFPEPLKDEPPYIEGNKHYHLNITLSLN